MESEGGLASYLKYLIIFLVMLLIFSLEIDFIKRERLLVYNILDYTPCMLNVHDFEIYLEI